MKAQIFGILGGVLLVAASTSTVSAQFSNRLVDPPATFGDNNQVDNQTEADSILASPPVGSTITTNTSSTINFPGNAPAGFANTDDFATESIGQVDVIGGTQGVFNLYVNGDDGFSLLRNGTEIARFENPTGSSNTLTNNVTLNDGDILTLRFFERGNGENLVFQTDSDGDVLSGGDRSFVGDAASGISIIPVPEPVSVGLLGLGAAGLLARRRRK